MKSRSGDVKSLKKHWRGVSSMVQKRGQPEKRGCISCLAGRLQCSNRPDENTSLLRTPDSAPILCSSSKLLN